MEDKVHWKSICSLSRSIHNAGNWTLQRVQCLWPSSHLLTPVCQASSAVSSETLSALCHGSLALGVTLPLTEQMLSYFSFSNWPVSGFSLLAPLRNLMTRSCFPRDLPSTASWCAAIAATYTLRVEGDSLRSNPSCRKESTTAIGHLRGSSRRGEHQLTNRFHFSL